MSKLPRKRKRPPIVETDRPMPAGYYAFKAIKAQFEENTMSRWKPEALKMAHDRLKVKRGER